MDAGGFGIAKARELDAKIGGGVYVDAMDVGDFAPRSRMGGHFSEDAYYREDVRLKIRGRNIEAEVFYEDSIAPARWVPNFSGHVHVDGLTESGVVALLRLLRDNAAELWP